MTRPKLAPRGDEGSGGGSRGLPRRATLRPEIRAAMALEESGELQEAARVFEYAGEHAQAALLRLEYARTIRDASERIDVLREGAARNSGSTPEGRTLHLALADALLDAASKSDDSASRRTLELEAGSALEEADEGGRAGEIFENLGMLKRAAKAYEASGEISRLELVLELLDRQDAFVRSQRDFEREVDEAIAHGQRRFAHAMLLEIVRGPGRSSDTQALARPDPAPVSGAVVPSSWAERLHRLEEKLLTRERCDLRWAKGVTSIRARREFRVGRAPDAELTIADARLSRYHVALSIDGREDVPRLMVTDLGSKAGAFLDGDPLLPGEPMPVVELAALGLGMTTELEIHPVGENGSLGAFVRNATARQGEDRWSLYLPGGGPLHLSPEIRVPARILFDRGYVVLDFAAGVGVTLHGRPLSLGASLELMLEDRLALVDVPLTLEVLG